MNHIFPILMSLTFLLSNLAQASDCRMRIVEANFDQSKLMRILEKKGYTMSVDLDAPFKLDVFGGDYGCYEIRGRPTFLESITEPTYSSIHFQGPDVEVSKEVQDAKTFPIHAEKHAIKRTLRWVKKLVPNCE